MRLSLCNKLSSLGQLANSSSWLAVLDTAHLLILYDHGPWLFFPRLGVVQSSSGTLFYLFLFTQVGSSIPCAKCSALLWLQGNRGPLTCHWFVPLLHIAALSPYQLYHYLHDFSLRNCKSGCFSSSSSSRGCSLLWCVASHCDASLFAEQGL